MTFEEALAAIREESNVSVDSHRESVAWLRDIPIPTSLVWLTTPRAIDPSNRNVRRILIRQRILRRIDAALTSDHPTVLMRAAYALCDRLALPVACGDVMRSVDPALDLANPYPLHLTHTPLGQPAPRWRGSGREFARDLRISYSHDHDSHLTLAACAPGLKGVGVDVVHLPRLRGERKNRAYLKSFARHFMSAEEMAGFMQAGVHDDEEGLRIRVAAHFSLMEAISKALGTGLKIGVGMGRPTSLPKQSLGVARLRPTVEFLITEEARKRIARLRGSRLTGYWGTDGEYLVSAAILQ